MTDVLLVSMPFGALTRPSIGLSLLKAGLAAEGHSVEVRYFLLKFAEMIGEPLYSRLSIDGRPSIRELVGEWMFSRALFESDDEEELRYVNDILRERRAWGDRSWTPAIPEALVQKIVRARKQVGAYLDWCVSEVERIDPKIVGFTSIFQQNVASLALARRIKAVRPDITIIFGGGNVEGVMGAEVVRQFDFVDAAVSGEGDLVFPLVVRQVLRGERIDVVGVRTRESVERELAGGTFSNAPSVERMDELPYADFSDFVAQFEASPFRRKWEPGLFYETSRGCWWGEKMHCTFCGLNGATMAFRSKSPTRAFDELLDLTRKYPGLDIQIVDNILDLHYFDDFIPRLAETKLDIALFYETKSNLRKNQVRLLSDGGFTEIQPGIESLSDSILKLMRKGVTGLQNIQLLKWSREHGVVAHWNLLWGFPGENPDEYRIMAERAALLTHLRPPVGISGIRLDRFSPNFNEAEAFGFTEVQPLAPYEYVYRLPQEAVANLAYYFRFRYRDEQPLNDYIQPLLRAVRRWQRVHGESELLLFRMKRGGVVVDLRGREVRFIALDRDELALYLAADAVADRRTLASVERQGSGELDEALERMIDEGIMLRDDNRFLSLAIEVGRYQPSAHAMKRIITAARKDGRATDLGWVIGMNGIRRSAHEDPKIDVKRGDERRYRVHPHLFSMTRSGDLLVRQQ